MILKTLNQNLINIKTPVSIKNVDNDKIVVSHKTPFCKKGFEYFIGYKDDKNKPLCVFLPKMTAYRKDFGETKYVSF